MCAAQPAHPSQKTEAASRRARHVNSRQAAVTTKAAEQVRTPVQAQAAPTPVRPVDQPAEPASVALLHGQLLVKADNSSLIQILDELAKVGGTSISGLGQDQRVFGDYGPGNPRQILSELLEGSGYNVLMVGVTREGAPRQLVLTARGSAPPSSPRSFPQHAYIPPRPPFRLPVTPMMPRPDRFPTPQQLMQQRERDLSQPHR